MSANLDINTKTGAANAAEFTYHTEQADADATAQMPVTFWHRDGTRVPFVGDVSGADQMARALDTTEMNFDVEARPLYYTTTDASGKRVVLPSTECRSIVRTDRGVAGVEIGSCGPDYVPVPNRDAFAPLIPFLDRGLLRLDTGIAMKGGQVCTLVCQWNRDKFRTSTQDVYASLGMDLYAVVSAYHTQGRSLTFAETAVRVVCANTQAAFEHDVDSGRRRVVAVAHRADAAERCKDAVEQLWGDIEERFARAAAIDKLLTEVTLSEDDFATLVLDVAVPKAEADPKFNPEARTATMVIERRERKRAEIRRLWDEGAGHHADHSAFEAQQALIQAVDHNAELFPSRAGAFRTARLLHGDLARMKSDVQTGLVEHAASALGIDLATLVLA